MAPSFINTIRSKSALQQVLLVATFLVCFYFITHWSSHSISVPPERAPLSTSSVVLPESKYAYAAFLAAPEQESNVDTDDHYFVATRMLAYQLLHDPATRTKQSIPFLVAVTDEVTQRKRDRLAADGAVILPVEKISFSWILASRNRWRDVLSKLRLFQLTQYERIFFLDSDMLIVKCMDGIFADPASVLALNANKTERTDEGPQPTSYVFAGVSGQGGYDHPWPPRKGRAVNAGFILFQPSIDLFNHYMTVAAIEGRFDPKYPEQNLWNYVHRREGNMPWAQLTPTWNVNWPTMNDYNNGAASLHAKFWDAGPEAELRDLLLRSRWKMEGSGEARDEIVGTTS